MAEPLLMQPSVLRRACFVVVGIIGTTIGAALVVVDSAGWALVPACGLAVLLEGARARVVVNDDHVVSTRAFRRTVVPIADIVGVLVPLWGPLALTLRAGASKRGGTLRPRNVVVTGLYADHHGRDRVAADLASRLGVPVSSIWPGVRSS